MRCRPQAARSSGLQLLGVVGSLHASGFALGYFLSRALGLNERLCRTNSIEVCPCFLDASAPRGARGAAEQGGAGSVCAVLRPPVWCTQVGMQNSTLGAVLASLHFSDPLVAAPCALSSCTHSVMGSLLAAYWRGKPIPDAQERA